MYDPYATTHAPSYVLVLIYVARRCRRVADTLSQYPHMQCGALRCATADVLRVADTPFQ